MDTSSDVSEIIGFNDISTQAVGGKALGLKKLIDCALPCPDGFVITDVDPENLPSTLETFYHELRAEAVAVRSSAIGEDGQEASFAGQFETVLNVKNFSDLITAITTCCDSLNTQQAQSYQAQQDVRPPAMCVVIQRMVNARAAGVLFTVDPVSNRYDRLVIDAVEGLGESLVSGETTPDHYEFSESGKCVIQELTSTSPILSAVEQEQLVTQARKAQSLAGEPLDMEWAIDQSGNLFWLQARPITTLASDLRALDTPLSPSDIVTTCNIGEMMPGACSPLTLSITGRGIEEGMQHMHVSYAGRTSITPDWTQVAISHGHLFLNLTGAAVASSTVLGVDVESLGQNLCGRTVEGLDEPKQSALPVRVWGFVKLLKYIFTADKAIAAFTESLEAFNVDFSGNTHAILDELDRTNAFLHRAYRVHLQSSSTSGFASTVLQRMLAASIPNPAEQEAESARLLAGATGVESAELVDELDALAMAIHDRNPNDANSFTTAPASEALIWLEQNGPTAIREDYNRFLQRPWPSRLSRAVLTPSGLDRRTRAVGAITAG